MRITGLPTVRDHRGAPRLSCHHALPEPIGGEFCAQPGAERPEPPTRLTRRAATARGSRPGGVLSTPLRRSRMATGIKRIASPKCPDRTIRRRLKAWAALGTGQQLHALTLRAYDQMIGLELRDVTVAGCIPRRPAAGSAPDRPGRSAQRRPETPGDHRGLRHPARDHQRLRPPPRSPAAGPHHARRRDTAQRRAA